MNLIHRKAMIRQRLAACAIASLGIAAADATTDTSTMTIGYSYRSGFVFAGFQKGVYGSMSPATLTGGTTYGEFTDAVLGSILEIDGFTSDPGQAWLTSATALTTTKTGASASYGYNASTGGATWTWTSKFAFNGPAPTAACTIVHN